MLKAVKFADIAPDLVSESFTKRPTSPKLTYLSATLLATALMCCIIISSADKFLRSILPLSLATNRSAVGVEWPFQVVAMKLVGLTQLAVL